MMPFAETLPGISAFDTYVALGIQLVREALFTPLEWVEKVTLIPAQVANMQERWLDEKGWVLVDPDLEWSVDKKSILSSGKNTPLLNQTLTGKVIKTFLI
ncbi:dihydroorotase-like cyclic amidohydrolase [Acinetobacter baylyi]|nr:dihydroorotase-like cyclic amidohydrolase [Acinetobacter baylyi]